MGQPTENRSCNDGQKRFWKKRRNLVAFLAFLGFFNLYALRVNLIVGVVAMTSSIGTKKTEFDWDSTLRGYVLSAHAYGYIATQMVGGTLSTKLGGVKLIGYGILMAACFTILTPLAARLSVYLAIACTVAVGMFEGFAFPSVNAVWSRWIPPAERTRMGSISLTGSYAGMIVGFPVCGWLANNYSWTYVFYVPGSMAILWSLVWLTSIGESPTKDVRISEEEREFIVSSIGPTNVQLIDFSNYPWKRIFTSMPVWAINCAHFCNDWVVYTLLTQLPSYMNDVFKFDIGKGSFLSALPYVAFIITIQIIGYFDFWLKQKKILTTTQIRKLSNSIAFLNRTVFLCLTAYSTTAVESVIYLTLSMIFGGFVTTGFGINHFDVAPQYASLLYGISNTFGTVSGFITPTLAGLIVQHKRAEEWKWVFIIASIVHAFGGTFYVLFSSGERQPWAETI